MAHTKVLLREDVDDLGARGEIVRVRAGYARNYLLPRNLAVEATAGNVKGIEGRNEGYDDFPRVDQPARRSPPKLRRRWPVRLLTA